MCVNVHFSVHLCVQDAKHKNNVQELSAQGSKVLLSQVQDSTESSTEEELQWPDKQ